MSDPLHTVIEADLKQAQRDRAKAFLLAVSLVGGVTAANRKLNAPGGPLVQKPLQIALTGLEVKPTPTGPATVRLPKAGLPGLAAPAPVGYVPAEYYGEHPDVVKQFLGFRSGSKPPVLNASDARIKVFEATRDARQITSQVIAGGNKRDAAGGANRFELQPGRLNITQSEFAFLKSLPPSTDPSLVIVPELEKNQFRFKDSVLLPGVRPDPLFPGEFVKDNPDGTFSPVSIENAYGPALENKAAKKGIDRELIFERADP